MSDNTNSGNALAFSPAEIYSGSDLLEEDLLAIATEKYPNKSYRTLTHWVIIEILQNNDNYNLSKFHETQSMIIFTEKHENEENSSTQEISGYKISFEDCFFETVDVVYILIGKGYRQFISEPLAAFLTTF